MIVISVFMLIVIVVNVFGVVISVEFELGVEKYISMMMWM